MPTTKRLPEERQNMVPYVMVAVISSLLTAGLLYAAFSAYFEQAPQAKGDNTIVAAGQQETATAVFSSVKDSVVHVSSMFITRDIFLRPVPAEGTGTGFIVSEDGLIYTNNHVIENAQQINVTLSDGTELPARLVGADPLTDIAVLKVDSPATLKKVRLGDSSTLVPGQLAIAIGNPYKLDNTVTVGVVSALNRTLEPTPGYTLKGIIQTDAAINPGNSGGPLLNAKGEVIGITSAKFLGDQSRGGAEGLSFAIPINTAKSIAEQIVEKGIVSRPWIGIIGIDMTPAIAKQLNVNIQSGVLLREVVKDGPAAKAGLRGIISQPGQPGFQLGDIITALDGKPIVSVTELIDIALTYRVNDQVTIAFYRDGSTQSTRLTFGARPKD
ncbi:MAG: trypsin-like peptidase domain-containing protein [Candidatus Aenigmarchaeota archaeon]|nr:trypsin-like peptidase domain-containing protein [Candidatus Aenigmarchaeota archaeon]